MKKSIFILLVFSAKTMLAQDFNGFRSGNYTGVNSVFFNPANIADSRYNFDFNLLGIGTTVGNNKASFKLSDFGNTIKPDSIVNQIFSKNTGPVSANISFVLNGPSLMISTGKKSAIALTTRSRVMMNITDLDAELGNQLMNNNSNTTYPYTIASTQNMKLNVNAWTEFGFSYASVLLDKGPSFLKAGGTIKYIAGVLNAYVNIDKLKTTINVDALDNAYLNNTSGKVSIGLGGINQGNFSVNDLTKFESSGFGADLGLVYEYRPDYAKYADGQGREKNKYKFKFGVSLLDLGSVSYTRDTKRSAGYNINIPLEKKLSIFSLADAGLDHLKDTLNKYPQFFTPIAGGEAATYKVALPGTLQLNADYHVKGAFYMNLSAQLSLSKGSDIYSSHYFNSFAFTPRLEGRHVGLYVPVAYNALTKATAGVALRLGSLFIGSSSIVSAALGGSKQADFFFGLRFGSLKKNKTAKAAKLPAEENATSAQ